jgi:hypothetical protein
VTSFTFNGNFDQTKVKDTDMASLAVVCIARGRPAANVTIYRVESNEIIGEEFGLESSDPLVVVTTAWSGSLSDVTVQHTGNYSCMAGNGVENPDQRTVELLVTCKCIFFVEGCPIIHYIH